jgi:transposase InsO family protein
MAYQFMKANLKQYPIKEMAGLLGVSRSACYQWASRGISQRRRIADEGLIHLIREIVINHFRRYGSPRVRQGLRIKYGKRVSLKKAARLMRGNGLNARRRRKFVPATDSKHTLPVCENILSRDFHAEKRGQKWVSDITYLRTIMGWIYLTVILGLHDRKVIGWALSVSLETVHTTVPALAMAVKTRAPQEGLIVHSDRGVQ